MKSNGRNRAAGNLQKLHVKLTVNGAVFPENSLKTPNVSSYEKRNILCFSKKFVKLVCDYGSQYAALPESDQNLPILAFSRNFRQITTESHRNSGLPVFFSSRI